MSNFHVVDQACWACGTVGTCMVVKVDEGPGVKFICKDECTWGKEDVKGLIEQPIQAGGQKFIDWLNGPDPVRALLIQ